MFEKILKKQSSTLPLKSVISDVHFIYIRLMFCLTLPWWKARCERAKRVNIDVIFWWYLLKCANLKRKSFLISIAGSRHINFLKKLDHAWHWNVRFDIQTDAMTKSSYFRHLWKIIKLIKIVNQHTQRMEEIKQRI